MKKVENHFPIGYAYPI